jgi:hypothetical protein
MKLSIATITILSLFVGAVAGLSLGRFVPDGTAPVLFVASILTACVVEILVRRFGRSKSGPKG